MKRARRQSPHRPTGRRFDERALQIRHCLHDDVERRIELLAEALGDEERDVDDGEHWLHLHLVFSQDVHDTGDCRADLDLAELLAVELGEVRLDVALVSIGRKPNVLGLDVEKAGIQIEKGMLNSR